MAEEKKNLIQKYEEEEQEYEYEEEMDEEEERERTEQEQKIADETIQYLTAARSELATLNKMGKALDSLKLEEKRLQKSIASEEKSIEDEIVQTVNRKRDEIEDKFESLFKENKEKEKKLLARRAKKKKEQIHERIKDETADVREENRSLSTQMDTLFKQYHIPSFCKTKLYYALFMTKGIVEMLEWLCIAAIVLGVVPALICIAVEQNFLRGVDDVRFYFALIMLGWIIFIFILYIVIMNVTKVKYYDKLLEGRKIFDKVKANDKKIAAITNAVKKDKDESQYDLEKYDQKLDGIKEEADSISKKRQEELREFENEEKQRITESIRTRRRDGLEAIKGSYKETLEKIEVGEQTISEQKEKIRIQYEKKLGTDFMDEESLRELIVIVQEGDADTVEDAIDFYNA